MVNKQSLKEIIENPQRLDKLHSLGLLDKASDSSFDHLTCLASKIFNTPISLFTLIDINRQFFKSQIGLDESSATTSQTTGFLHSFCQHIFITGDPLVITDTREHDLVRDKVAITGLNMVSYVGVPLMTSDGYILGTFCVIDDKVRNWTDDDVFILKDLAKSTITEIELRNELTERKKLNEQFHEQQILYQSIIDNSPAVIFIKKADGTYLSANTAYEKRTGIKRSEMIGKTDFDFYSADIAEQFRKIDLTVFNSGETIEVEGSYPYGDTTEVSLTTKFPLYDAQGFIYGLCGIATDITELKKAEMSLEKQSQFLFSIMDSVPNLIYIKNADGTFALVNRAVARRYNMMPGELVGKSDSELLLDSAEVANFSKADKYVLETGQSLHIPEESVTMYDGSVYWYQTAKLPIVSQDGESVQILGISTDITLRKLADESIRKSENQYRQILNAIPDFVVVKNADSKIVWANKAFTDYFNIMEDSIDTYVSAPYEKLEHIQQYIADDKKVFETGRALEIPEEPMTSPDGVTEIFYTSKTPIFDDAGNVTMIVSISRNITEQRELERELVNSLAKEREVNELRQRFTSMVSHEFRTPLTVILSSNGLINKFGDKIPADKRQLHLDKIDNQVHLMLGMLNDVLDYGRVENLLNEIHQEKVDLVVFCKDMIDEIRQVSKHHQVAFKTNIESFEMMLDVRLIRHIIGNLLSNAVKYSPAASDINFSLEHHQDEIIIRVQDHGIGIPEKDQREMFSMFHRASNVNEIQGTGLGLAITKQAVEAHQGKIHVLSTENVGTTVSVSLPINPDLFQQNKPRKKIIG